MLKSLVLKQLFLGYRFVNLPIKSKYYHQVLPSKVAQIMILIKREQKLNQKCFLLQHLAQVLQKDRHSHLSHSQRKLILNELSLWSNQSGRSHHIATIAYVLKKLNLQNVLQPLYNQIKQRFLDDQWYVNFDQSIKAMEVFCQMENGKDKQIIMKKIQRNLGITMWNVNMKYYSRIAQALLIAGRNHSPLWARMETQILENLDMSYDTKTVSDIFKAYALSRNGSDVFYQMMEKVLFQGHFSEFSMINHKNFSKQYDQSGEFFSLVIQTYAIASKSCGVILTPDFKDYVYQSLTNKKTQYKSLNSISRAILSLQSFQFQPSQIIQIQMLLLQKKPTQISLTQIKQFYQLMKQRHGQIPTQIHSYLEDFFIKEVNNRFLEPVQVVQFVNYLITNKCILKEQTFYYQVNHFLEQTYKYLYPQQAKYIVTAINQTKLIAENKHLLKLPSAAKQLSSSIKQSSQSGISLPSSSSKGKQNKVDQKVY